MKKKFIRLKYKTINWLIAMGILITPDRRMFRIKVSYNYNGNKGTMWVVADDHLSALELTEKKLRERYYVEEFQDLQSRYQARVVEVRIVSRLRWL